VSCSAIESREVVRSIVWFAHNSSRSVESRSNRTQSWKCWALLSSHAFQQLPCIFWISCRWITESSLRKSRVISDSKVSFIAFPFLCQTCSFIPTHNFNRYLFKTKYIREHTICLFSYKPWKINAVCSSGGVLIEIAGSLTHSSHISGPTRMMKVSFSTLSLGVALQNLKYSSLLSINFRKSL